MKNLLNTPVELLATLLSGETGLQAELGIPVYLAELDPHGNRGVRLLRYAPGPDAEQTINPGLFVYCEKLTNTGREKFRAFSGTAQLVVEIRAGGDRIAEAGDMVQRFAGGVVQVLNVHRGDWGEGVFYGGTYEVAIQAAKKGRSNYVQAARVVIVVNYNVG
ncbi:MAG: hypothetical protein HYZ37_10140 [Candidatus Solibacter usitatus]|nr:hypothetical protein [Candidatus Solibacter usitatus]